MRTASLLYVFQASEIQHFEKDNKLYIKFFLLDATLNQNKWRVTWEAIKEHHADFVGKPFIILPNKSHPYPRDPEKIFQAQKPYEKGKIIETGLDQAQKKAWAIAEITDPVAQKQIQNGEIKFVSPSMLSYNHQIMFAGEEKIIMGFEAAHVAGVSDPAYGVMSAQIKGTCACKDGQCDSCINTLKMVQAEVSVEEISDNVIAERIADIKNRIVTKFKLMKALQQILTQEPDNKVIQEEVGQKKSELEWMVIDLIRMEKAQMGIVDASIESVNADSKCVSACLEHKSDNGIEIDDQAIAICHNECYKNNSNGELASYNDSYKDDTHKKKLEMAGNEDLAKTLENLKAEFDKVKTDLKETKSKYDADITKLQTEKKELMEKLDAEAKKPYIQKIVAAKTKLNLKAEKEEEELAQLDINNLKAIEKQYSGMTEAMFSEDGEPRLPYPTEFHASTDPTEKVKRSSNLLKSVNGVYN